MSTIRFKGGIGPIGCAVSEDAVRLIQLWKTGPDQFEIRSGIGLFSAQAEHDGESHRHSLVAALRQALMNVRFHGRQVVTCLPTSRMTYRPLRLAPMPDEEMLSAVHWQLTNELSSSSHDLKSAFYDVGDVLDSGKRKREVIAVAAPVRELESHVDMIRAAGLKTHSIDSAPGALARSFLMSERTSRMSDPVIVIDLLDSGSTLMIAHEGVPRFIRPISSDIGEVQTPTVIPSNTEMVTQPDTYPTAVTSARELAHQVNLCLHYLHGAGLDAICPRVGYIVAGGEHEEAIRLAVNETAEIEFQRLADALGPRISVLLSECQHANSLGDWLVPLGLALYGREHLVMGTAA